MIQAEPAWSIPGKIACGTDFSEGAHEALQWAVALAEAFEAELKVIHAFQTPIYLEWTGGSGMAPAQVGYLDDLRTQTSAQLERLCSEVTTVAARPCLVDGMPHRVLVEESKHVDLLVLGTHGRTGAARVLLGSVAERVVRSAYCPVLTVPPG